jgi:hypothetical protein
MADPVYYHFPNLGIVLCAYHKETLLIKDPKQDFVTVEPGFALITEWCNFCADVIIRYEKGVK